MVFIVPQFGRDEEIFAWNAAPLDSSSDSFFSAITNTMLLVFMLSEGLTVSVMLTHGLCRCGDSLL